MAQHDSNNIINKVIYDGNVLIDLTNDTITAADVINNKTFHLADGTTTTGSCTYDADTSDATANTSEILATKTAYKNGVKLTGEMTNNGGSDITVTGLSGNTIPSGYYDGSGKAVIDPTSASNLISTNIRNGITILGVEGLMTAEDALYVGSVNVTPSTSEQIVTAASESYDYITQVVVAEIPYVESSNNAGGFTVTIG